MSKTWLDEAAERLTLKCEQAAKADRDRLEELFSKMASKEPLELSGILSLIKTPQP